MPSPNREHSQAQEIENGIARAYFYNIAAKGSYTLSGIFGLTAALGESPAAWGASAALAVSALCLNARSNTLQERFIPLLHRTELYKEP